MSENETVVSFPKTKRRPKPSDNDTLARDVRSAYKKLCKAIDAATAAGLKVRCSLDSGDTYGGGLVRGRDVEITQKL